MVKKYNNINRFKKRFDSCKNNTRVITYYSYHSINRDELIIITYFWLKNDKKINFGYTGPWNLSKRELNNFLKEINSEEIPNHQQLLEMFS